jgi:PmbA protein
MTINDLKLLIQGLFVSAWEIKRINLRSYQRYLIFDQIESERFIETQKYIVTLYKEKKQKENIFLGESTFSISEGENVRERLVAGIEMADLVANPIFFLPDRGLSYEQVQTFDPKIKANPRGIIDQIQDDLIREPLDKVKRSSAEIFVEEKDQVFINSNGLELESSETEVLIDFVLLAKKGGNLEGESQGIKRVRSYEDLHLKEMVQKYSQYARETITAGLPKAGVYPVVFSEEALDTLFNFFCIQTSGLSRFQGWTQFTIGEPVISDLKGEPLTLISRPGLKGGTKSRSFDNNGLPLHRVEVIQNNIFQKRMNNKRYADYLQEEATGDFANIEIGTGSNGAEDLLEEGPCYHLLRFSTFDPNSITGTFSGEIRTGYFIKGGKSIPIKGGSVSGVMQEAFKKVFFSKEMTQRDFYLGPKTVRIEGLSIAGD